MAQMQVNATGGKHNPSFYCNEGAFTYNAEVETIEGKKVGGAFAAPMKKGMTVQIDTDSDMTVEPFSAGIAIGTLSSTPKGDLPRANKAEHAYLMRLANVELDPDIELDWVKLADTHAAVAPGTYLAHSTNKDEYVVEEDTTTNVIALQTRALNETGYVLVIKRGASQNAAD